MRRRAPAAAPERPSSGAEGADERFGSDSSSRARTEDGARRSGSSRASAPAEDPTELLRLRFHTFTLAQSVTHNLVRRLKRFGA